MRNECYLRHWTACSMAGRSEGRGVVGRGGRREGGGGGGREGGGEEGGGGRGLQCMSLSEPVLSLTSCLCSHTGKGENRIEVEELTGGREELTLGEGWRHSLCLTRSTTSLSLPPSLGALL